jgi:hypothetical protein
MSGKRKGRRDRDIIIDIHFVIRKSDFVRAGDLTERGSLILVSVVIMLAFLSAAVMVKIPMVKRVFEREPYYHQL